MSFLKSINLYLLTVTLKAIQAQVIPYLKVVQGSFNQEDRKFGETADRQCAFITLFSIAWSAIRRVGLWNTLTPKNFDGTKFRIFFCPNINPSEILSCPKLFPAEIFRK